MPNEKRKRYTITATYDMPEGDVEYQKFRRKVQMGANLLEKEMGIDVSLEYLAIEEKKPDVMLKD